MTAPTWETAEVRLWVLNDEGIYRATHDREGRYVMASAEHLRRAVPAIPEVKRSRVDWQEVHRELLDGNE